MGRERGCTKRPYLCGWTLESAAQPPDVLGVVLFQIIGTYLHVALHLICMLLIKRGHSAETLPPPSGWLLSPAQILGPFILPISPSLLWGKQGGVSQEQHSKL